MVYFHTNILVCALYHFNRLMYFGLNGLWVNNGRSEKREVTRVHKMINGMGNNVVDVLPVIHVL